MGVDQRSGRPPLTEHERGDQVREVVAAVRALAELGRVGQVGSRADLPCAGAARGVEQWVDEELVRAELADAERAALAGDGCSARRVAELYQTLHEFDRSIAWWRTAAELGDEDAADYVRYTLD
ncbi:hypothetical protein JOD54_001158 [Actinokineospora baliensis]|uniref:hypothetical protein n=1 Tax=Actinokineospora baliensis TaxID=547056 RepID=UPI00195BDF63|nr:hypothetical protein [Actinokineospora baliensis]MBM7770954.1 hypothetical protein [Actinokineospora baliensis]